jgi:uncharacterized protein Veg
MEKDIHNIDKINGKTLHYSDTVQSDLSQTISDFLKGVQNVSIQQTTSTFTNTGDIVGENVTVGILNVIQKFSFNGNFIMLENEDFAADTTISESPNFVLLATDNNHGMYLRVPYIYARGADAFAGEVLEYDYVPFGQEPAETWLTITDSKFKVTGPFTQIKSDKVAIRDKILTVGYIDRVELSDSNFTLNLEDGNNIESATCRGIDFEYIDDDNPETIKMGFFGYSFELDRWVLYKDVDYQMDGDLKNEMKISKNSPDNLNKCEIDHIYTNKIYASDHTTLDYIEIMSNDYLKLCTGGTLTYPSTVTGNSLYISALTDFETYVKNGHMLLNTGGSMPSSIADGQIYLNAEDGLFARSYGGDVTLNSQDVSSIILAGSTSITTQLTKSGTTYKSVMSSSGFTFGTGATTWITIGSSSIYSNNSNFTFGTNSSKIGSVYVTNLYATTLTQDLDINNQTLTNVKINSGSINGATIGVSSPSTGAFTTLTASGVLSITSTVESVSTITGALVISGGVGIAKNTYIGGNVNVSGTTSITNTTDSSSSITGSVILSGGVGIAKKLYIGSTLNVAGATLLSNTLGISGVTSVTDTTQSTSTITGATVISGGLGVARAVNIGGTLNVAGITSITDTTQSTSTITGATVISGGLGVSKATYLGGILNVIDTTQSTSTITGAIVISGGLGVAKATYLGGTLNVTGVTSITDATQSTSTITGATIISGGLGVVKNTNIGGTLNVAGITYLIDTTQSSATTNGSLIVSGGMGIAKNVYIGGAVNISDTTQSSSTITGSLVASGGLGIAKNAYIGGTLNVAGVTTITNTTQSTVSTNGALVVSGGLGIAKDVFIGGSLSIGANFSAVDLSVSGTFTTGSNGSASDSIFYSDIAGKNMTWDTTNAKLVITGVNNTTSLNVSDGDVSIADNLYVNGETTLDKVTIDTTDGDFSVSGSNQITLSTTANEGSAITLTTNGGTNETIVIKNTQGTNTASINIVSDTGGITLNASELVTITNGASVGGTFDVNGATTLDKVTIDTTDGDFSVSGSNQITLSTTANEGSAITLTTNGGTNETIVIKNTQGTNTSAIALVATTGGITIDSAGVLELNSSNGIISIGNDNVNKNINIATAGTRTITLGTTTTTLDVNAAGITIDGTTLAINSTDTTDLTMSANNLADKTLTISATNAGVGVGNIDISSDGSTTITSTANSANSIYLRANGGTNDTIKIHADQSTLVTSVNIVSDVGGITLTAYDLVTITNDASVGGTLDVNGETTLDKVTIDTTDGEFLVSGSNKISLSTTANEGSAITLTADGGTNETIVIKNTQGINTASINIASDSGGITLTAYDLVTITNDASVGGTLDVNGETTLDKVTIDTTDGEFLVSGSNKISLSTTANEGSAITLTADGGTNETIVIKNTQGTNTSAIALVATAGGITIDSAGVLELNSSDGIISIGNDDVNKNIDIATAGTRIVTLGTTTTTLDVNADEITIDGTTLAINSTDTTDLTMSANNSADKTLSISATNAGTGAGHIVITTDGNTTMTSNANNSKSIYIHADGGETESIVVHADQGTSANSIELTSDAGGITLNAMSGAGGIALTGITNYYSKIIETGGTNTTLTNSQSGSIVLISGENDIVTLPTNTSGTTFKIISTITSAGNMEIKSAIDNDVTFIGTTLLTQSAGVVHDSTTACNSVKLTTKAHDGVIFDCYATGSVWVIRSFGTNNDITSGDSIYTTSTII